MPIRLTSAERRVAAKLAELKRHSGSHSPSPAELSRIGVQVKHDFCYLSNPHATELFVRYFRKDFRDDKKLRTLVEHYPSQNRALAEKLSQSPLVKGALRRNVGGGLSPLARGALRSYAGGVSNNPRSADGAPPLLRGITEKNIFVGNGATEIIQAVLQTFVKPFVGVKLLQLQNRRSLTPTKILVPVPTFSPYLEFAPKGVKVVQHQLRKESNFSLDVAVFLAQVKREKPDTVVIINPNNPDGGYLLAQEMQSVLAKLKSVGLVVVDESFIHFAEDGKAADERRHKSADSRGLRIESVAPLVSKYPNLIVIKSLSKDFGIAGLRLGYAVMSEKRVTALLERGYLWNVSGFGEYFLDLLNRKDFLEEYEKTRLKAIRERGVFFRELSGVPAIKVYPSKANMFLVELFNGTKASDLCIRLLVKHGIYVRTCYDKVGLTGEFIRIASRTAHENTKLVGTLQKALFA